MVCDPSPYFYKGVSVPCEHYLGYDRFEHATNFNSAPGSTYQFALGRDFFLEKKYLLVFFFREKISIFTLHKF